MKHGLRAPWCAALAFLTAAGFTTACASPAPASTPSVAQAADADAPSASAQMICAPEAVAEVANAVGIAVSQTPTHTWSDHLYTCRYGYPSAVMGLSVKELPSAAATDA